MRAVVVLALAISLHAGVGVAAEYSCRMYKPGGNSGTCEFRTGEGPCTRDLSAAISATCDAARVPKSDSDKLECSIDARAEQATQGYSAIEAAGFSVSTFVVTEHDEANGILNLAYKRDKNTRVTRVTCDRK